MFTQQCSFNPKGLFFKKAPPSFQITTGIKKNLIKGPEARSWCGRFSFLGIYWICFGKINTAKLIPVMLNFILSV